MLYLLDANVLIDAHRDYYPIERVPEFWDWLLDRGISRRLAIPTEVYEEIMLGRGDRLTKWLRRHRDVLLLEEEADPSMVSDVTVNGYAANLTDEEVERMGADPFLIAYVYVDPARRTVVTTEHSKPSRTGANRHIPDVCRKLNIPCCGPFELIRALDFSTDWRR